MVRRGDLVLFAGLAAITAWSGMMLFHALYVSFMIGMH